MPSSTLSNTTRLAIAPSGALLSWKLHDRNGSGSAVGMSRPTVREINYVDFKRILERAAAAGTRVEKTDPARWSAYVRLNGVKEAGFHAYARSHSESLKPVIVDAPEPDGGYYLFSDRDEVCVKWIRRVE